MYVYITPSIAIYGNIQFHSRFSIRWILHFSFFGKNFTLEMLRHWKLSPLSALRFFIRLKGKLQTNRCLWNVKVERTKYCLFLYRRVVAMESGGGWTFSTELSARVKCFFFSFFFSVEKPVSVSCNKLLEAVLSLARSTVSNYASR